jgi:anti-sigma-K factor RskA
MIPVRHIDPDDIALYAMQLLPSDETEEMTQHLQHSAEARRVLGEIYSDLSLFAQTAETHSPPALARERLLQQVAREKKPVPVDPFVQASGAFTPRANVLRIDEEVIKRTPAQKLLPWLGWALAAGMAAMCVNLYLHQIELTKSVIAAEDRASRTQLSAEAATNVMETLKDPLAVHFTLTSSDLKPPPSGRVTYVSSKGALVLTANNLAPLAPYKTYELWLIPMDQRDPIPAGTFRPDDRGFATVVLPDLPRGVTAKTFGVTIEDGGGSQTPTMPIVLKGITS